MTSGRRKSWVWDKEFDEHCLIIGFGAK